MLIRCDANINTVAIVQARLSSSRLPGKVLKELCGKPVLKHVLDRLECCSMVNSVVVATTRDESDEALVQWCEEQNIDYYRGEREDVLSRFYECAIEYDADNIVRVTSDNPLVDPSIVDSTIELFIEKGADYGSNSLKKTFPHGLDVEVLTFEALEESHREATEYYEREHVTQFIRHRPQRYHLCNLESDGDWNDIRVTLDEDVDLQLIKLLIRLLGENVDFYALKKLFSEYPALTRVNASAREWHADYNQRENII